MTLILTQKLYEQEYDDIVGEQYHHPRRYWSYIKPGERFIYYHPSERLDPSSYYFGVGRIGEVHGDAGQPDHRYAEILDYMPFDLPVTFKENGEYLEARPDAGTQFFRAVRLVSQEVWHRILSRAQVDPLDMSEFEGVHDIDALEHIISAFDERYRNLEPRLRQSLVKRIDRPTVLSRALKEKLGYRCQICGMEGFAKKAGGRYAEAHHLLELHRLEPGSLVSENILIVCANCHRKLHYADVEVALGAAGSVHITINGILNKVQRNF